MITPQSVVDVLVWMVIAIGGGLLGLLIWIGKRVHTQIDKLPDEISEQVGKVHKELVSEMKSMNETHAKLEHDLRSQFASLDRRVTRLEVIDEINGGKS